jgi:hypothetical protein
VAVVGKLLFASIHTDLDPSSGAALATRELLELLEARGMHFQAFTMGMLDYERDTPIEDIFANLELPARRRRAELNRGGAVGSDNLIAFPSARQHQRKQPGTSVGKTRK